VIESARPVPVLYLHGFTSSSASSKALYLGERLRSRGVTFVAPDFNLPEFRTLTMIRMLQQVEQTIAGLGAGEVDLIGSSLGGALAVLAAGRFRKRVRRLVLLAPAVMLARPGHHLVPPERIEEWRANGAMAFFHHAYGEKQLLDFAFYADSIRYDPFETSFSQPTLVFQGVDDVTVDPAAVQEFARARENVRLSLLQDDHQLLTSLPRIWEELVPFLDLAPSEESARSV
jgi:pimeloyl-ACP methyl ester carboxylesterase